MSLVSDPSISYSGVLRRSMVARSSRSASLTLKSVVLLPHMGFGLPPGSPVLSDTGEEADYLPADLLKLLVREPFYSFRHVRFVVIAIPAPIFFPPPVTVLLFFLLLVLLVYGRFQVVPVLLALLRPLFAAPPAALLFLPFPAVFFLWWHGLGERKLRAGGVRRAYLFEEPPADTLLGLLVGELRGPAAGACEILASEVVVVSLRADGPVGELREIAAGFEGRISYNPQLAVAQGLAAQLFRESIDVRTAVGDGDADPGPPDLRGEGEGSRLVCLSDGGEVDVREAVAVEPVAVELVIRSVRSARQHALRDVVEVQPLLPVVRRSVGPARVDDRGHS